MCEDEPPCEKYKKKCPSNKCNPIYLRNLPARSVVKARCNELVLTNQQLGLYMKNFLNDIRKGLRKESNPTAIVKCFPTFVQDLPDGTEEGKFLAIDLGGSNYRMLMVTITPGEEMAVETGIGEIPEEIMTGPGADLFDFIAEKLDEFCGEHGVSGDGLPLGFTFSFPLVQKGLKVGILERWTKGFSCDGVIGQDVVTLLRKAIKKREGLSVKIVAVLNDTTGTLMSCAFEDNECKIGLIVGTGTNGCYVEKQFEAELFDEPDRGSGIVIINMESGAFGDDGALDFCRTEYDIEVDKASINPGRQLHEKMISGMYLGELVRLAAVKFANEGIMFSGRISDDFNTVGKFETKFVSDIESDKPCTYDQVKQICDGLGVTWATVEDYQDLRYICACFSRRAAYLVACSITVLIRKMDYKTTTIGIDGTLYKLHPHFHDLLTHKIKELLLPDSHKFKIMASSDGSGIGAALVAAVAAKNAPPEEEGGDGEGEDEGEEAPPEEEE